MVLAELLNDESQIVRTAVAVFIVFAPLYYLSSLGWSWPGMVAVAALMSILVWRQKKQGSLGFSRGI